MTESTQRVISRERAGADLEDIPGPLDRIRILDLADEKAGFCTKILADLGARVVKVEKPGGDDARKRGLFRENAPPSETSLSFLYNNGNKLGITLDLEQPEGRSIFRKLVENTDVIVETFPPGYLKGIGLDFESASEINPGVIYASVTGFGQDGPRREYKTCDLVASAYGGQMFVSGSPSRPPLRAFGEQSYYAASLFAATGVLLALMNRKRTGRGEHLDISLQDSVSATLEHVMVRFLSEGVVHRRQESLHWNGSFVVLPCKDGFIHVSLFEHWETLIGWLEAEGMAEDLRDPKWLDEDYRRQFVGHVIGVLERWTKSHTTEEIFHLSQLMRFPWAPVQSPWQVLRCPQLQERRFFAETPHPESEISLKHPKATYRFGHGRIPGGRLAPLPGEHNGKVYGDELGFPEETLKQLSSRRVI